MAKKESEESSGGWLLDLFEIGRGGLNVELGKLADFINAHLPKKLRGDAVIRMVGIASQWLEKASGKSKSPGLKVLGEWVSDLGELLGKAMGKSGDGSGRGKEPRTIETTDILSSFREASKKAFEEATKKARESGMTAEEAKQFGAEQIRLARELLELILEEAKKFEKVPPEEVEAPEEVIDWSEREKSFQDTLREWLKPFAKAHDDFTKSFAGGVLTMKGLTRKERAYLEGVSKGADDGDIEKLIEKSVEDAARERRERIERWKSIPRRIGHGITAPFRAIGRGITAPFRAVGKKISSWVDKSDEERARRYRDELMKKFGKEG